MNEPSTSNRADQEESSHYLVINDEEQDPSSVENWIHSLISNENIIIIIILCTKILK